MVSNQYIESQLDDLLETEVEIIEANAVAIKRAITWELSQKMTSESYSETKMAERIETSRSALDRLLNLKNTSVTLHTLDKAAHAIREKLNIEPLPLNN